MAKRGFHSQHKLIGDCPAIRRHRAALCELRAQPVSMAEYPFGGSLISDWPKQVMKPQPHIWILLHGRDPRPEVPC